MRMTTPDELTLPHAIEHDRTSVIRGSLLGLWRTRGLNRLLNRALVYAPHSVRSRLEAERRQVRAAELEARIRSRARLVPETELHRLLVRGLSLLADRHGCRRLGDYLEFGVYNGTSLACTYRALTEVGLDHVRLFGFDSFEGFPPHAALEDEGRWQPGRCCCPIEFTSAVLEREGVDARRVTLVPGWFSETLNAATRERHRIDRASVIMIDCDLYSSTSEALRFCAPLIHDEALVLFDEYYPSRLRGKHVGERKAFEEFLEESGSFRASPFGQYAARTQAFMVRRTH
jgi:hypothetical protein